MTADHPSSESDARRRDAALSPSITRDGAESVPAYEMKFLVREDAAAEVTKFARAHLEPDPFANPDLGGAYEITTLYLDTPDFDVYYGTEALGGAKYRVRRYGTSRTLFCERKRRVKNRVAKRRTEIPDADLPRLGERSGDPKWIADWFHETMLDHELRPTCTVTYERTAFFGLGKSGPLRLTLDRRVRGAAADALAVVRVAEGVPVLDGEVIVELKFQETMPNLFKELVESLHLAPTTASKYRRVMNATGALERRTR